MTLSMARQIVLAARPQGTPQLTDFRLEETAIPTPAAGLLLLGGVMDGESVATVIVSQHPGYLALT